MAVNKASFYYTHSHDFDWASDLVSKVWFNENTGELLVALNGGRAYKYANFILDAYVTFAKASSAGKYYNDFLKSNRAYPSLGFQGYVDDINFVLLPSRKTGEATHEVTLVVSTEVKVRVSADDFGSAETLAIQGVNKTYDDLDSVVVKGIEKL